MCLTIVIKVIEAVNQRTLGGEEGMAYEKNNKKKLCRDINDNKML